MCVQILVLQNKACWVWLFDCRIKIQWSLAKMASQRRMLWTCLAGSSASLQILLLACPTWFFLMHVKECPRPDLFLVRFGQYFLWSIWYSFLWFYGALYNTSIIVLFHVGCWGASKKTFLYIYRKIHIRAKECFINYVHEVHLLSSKKFICIFLLRKCNLNKYKNTKNTNQ